MSKNKLIDTTNAFEQEEICVDVDDEMELEEREFKPLPEDTNLAELFGLPEIPKEEIRKQLSTDEIINRIYANAQQTFLSKYTIPMIEAELKEYILGQDELIKHVATFIYYHMLRQIYLDLNMRPMLISGPSGSGKTEVWRVAKKLFDKYLEIEIVDGSSITQDGWSGQRKLSSIMKALGPSTILVIDEFDKLATPTHSKHGDNVSGRIQSEFLKLLEGDYNTIGFRKDDESDGITYDANSLGIVLIGAFEGIRSDKENRKERIGFSGETRNKAKYEALVPITDEDLIKFGVLPELVGRIADKCTTNKLTAKQYLKIIRNENSRVNELIFVLNQLGISTRRVLSDKKIMELAEQSQVNMLGVRWVSAQVESILLELLTKADVRKHFTARVNFDDMFKDNKEMIRE